MPPNANSTQVPQLTLKADDQDAFRLELARAVAQRAMRVLELQAGQGRAGAASG